MKCTKRLIPDVIVLLSTCSVFENYISVIDFKKRNRRSIVLLSILQNIQVNSSAGGEGSGGMKTSHSLINIRSKEKSIAQKICAIEILARALDSDHLHKEPDNTAAKCVR